MNYNTCKICDSEAITSKVLASHIADYYLCEDCESDIRDWSVDLEDE